MRHQAEEKQLVAKGVHLDNKNRVSLGAVLKKFGQVGSFDVYLDGRGCIILEPQVSIPASEAWLYLNKPARESVGRGLKDLAAGKSKAYGSFAKYADDDEA